MWHSDLPIIRVSRNIKISGGYRTVIRIVPPSLSRVVLEGTVELNRREKDGDRHLRICAGGFCLVVECIPELPEVEKVCATAHRGDQVWVTGITRFDGGHGRHTPADAAKYAHAVGWWELHPITALEVK